MDHPIAQLEALYRETAPALLAYFRRQRPLAMNAEDLLHDTFVRAIRSQHRIDGAVTPRAYLFGIARHVGLDALRRHAPIDALTTEPAAPAPAPEDENLERMRNAISELPELQREALLLKLHHDLSYAEIAEVLGIPIGTVRSRLHHAVAELRGTLNPPSSGP
jgi:RNA polymerase sigma-70 factor, ECF subfamily